MQLDLPLLAVSPAEEPEAPLAVHFVRRRGTRRYILRVLEDGSLRVTLPWWGSRKDAHAFVASQAAWIAAQRARRAERPDRSWRAGHAVLVDGERLLLDLVPDGNRRRVECGGQLVARDHPVSGDLRPAVEAWLRRRARTQLTEELIALAAAHDVTITVVSIRNQRSRWGSCSRRGGISLNWRLVQVPPFVREYVLIHELMHRRELNHSTRFWRHVANACPRYLDARRWLRTEGQQLF